MYYNKTTMIKMHVEYLSPNDIYFHHSTNYFDNKGFHRAPELHRQCEILYLISGKIQYRIDGESYDVSAGDVILVNICELHSIQIEPTEPYERMVLQFSPNAIPKFTDFDPLEPFTNARAFRHILPHTFVKKSKIYKILNQIKKDCTKLDKLTDFKIIASVMDILTEINQTKTQMLSSKTDVVAEAANVQKFSKLCTDYISEHLTKKITAKEIADHLHVCESHLHHLFRKEMGISLHVYILNQKMQLAMFMLNSGQNPQQVSEALGYDYYSTFFNNFQSCFGFTPNQYHKNKRRHKVAPSSLQPEKNRENKP